MSSKLYVTNLSTSATLSSVRQFFATAGQVLDVEFAAERSNSGSRSSAYVTMANAVGAQDAVRKLHGRLFHDRSVMISEAPSPQGGGREDRKSKAATVGVTVAQQYRERQGMAYELDCAGLRLTLRFAFPDAERGDARHVEARTNAGSELVVEATAATRELALEAAADAWRRLPAEPPAPIIDWAQVTAALKTVRAV